MIDVDAEAADLDHDELEDRQEAAKDERFKKRSLDEESEEKVSDKDEEDLDSDKNKI